VLFVNHTRLAPEGVALLTKLFKLNVAVGQALAIVVDESVGAVDPDAQLGVMELLPNEMFQKLPFVGAAAFRYLNPMLKVVAVAVKVKVF
jgi:hypothetical protein